MTTADRHQKLLDTIKKLLRQAEDADLGDRPQEAAAYQEKAFDLMAEHGVSDAMLRAQRDDARVDANAESVTVHLTGSYLPMQQELFWGLSRVMHCRAVGWPVRNKKAKMEVFGMPDHLRRVRDMWMLLIPQAERGIANAHPGRWSSAAQVTSFRRGWIEGFGQTVCGRIAKAENKAATAGKALQLYVSDAKRAEIAMYDKWPGLKTAKGHTRERELDYDGYDGYFQGCMDGESAQLNRSIQ